MEKAKELRGIINNSTDALESIEKNDWIKKDMSDKWSKKEVLGHLIDSATTNLRRFVVTQYEQNQKIIYHQDEWVQIQNYQEVKVSELIGLWKSLNLQIAHVISQIPEAKLQNTCDTGKGDAQYFTLEFLITDYITHLRHHLAQIYCKNDTLN